MLAYNIGYDNSKVFNGWLEWNQEKLPIENIK
jgi:hypothetical protein